LRMPSSIKVRFILEASEKALSDVTVCPDNSKY
jgi:hypothetical protein